MYENIPLIHLPSIRMKQIFFLILSMFPYIEKIIQDILLFFFCALTNKLYWQVYQLIFMLKFIIIVIIPIKNEVREKSLKYFEAKHKRILRIDNRKK